MGDEYGEDGWEPATHDLSADIGTFPGIHGVPADQLQPHPPAPEGTPLPDVTVPPPVPADGATSWLEEAGHELYHAVTAPPDLHEPDPYLEEADRERRADEQSYDEETGTHSAHAPKAHF